MNKNILDRLAKYSAAAASVTAMTGTANAQIIYTDINPDISVVDSGFYLVDFNLDNVWDVGLAAQRYVSSTSSVGLIMAQGNTSNSASSNGIMFTTGSIPSSSGGTNTYYAAVALDNGENIGASGNFASSSAFLAFDVMSSGLSFAGGQFLNTTDKYVGARFEISGLIHYGWIRLDCDATGSQFTIKDYAYNLTPNELIPAGQTGGFVGVSDLSATSLNVVYSDNVLQVTNLDASVAGELRVYNLNGQEVMTEAIDASGEQIQINDLAAGLYVARVRYGTDIVTKRIVIN
jgi:hypothetical protein